MLLKNALWIALTFVLLVGHAIAQEAPDDDPIGDICTAQEQALESCATTNGCLECENQLGEEPAEPGMEGDDPSQMMSQMQGYLDNNCAYVKDSVCKLKECCPACESEIQETYTCYTAGVADAIGGLFEGLGGFIDSALSNVTTFLDESGVGDVLDEIGDALGNVTEGLADGLGDLLGGGETEAPAPTAVPAPVPDLDFNCDISALVCEGGTAAPGPAPGPDAPAPGPDAPAPAPGDPTPAPAPSGAKSTGLMAVGFLATLLMIKNF